MVRALLNISSLYLLIKLSPSVLCTDQACGKMSKMVCGKIMCAHVIKGCVIMHIHKQTMVYLNVGTLPDLMH